MISVTVTNRFKKAVTALGPQERQRAQKSIKQFLADPRYPALHFEKIASGYHTIRVDMNFRIAMRKVSNVSYELVDIDNHTAIYQRWS